MLPQTETEVSPRREASHAPVSAACFFSGKNLLFALAASGFYLLLSFLLVGFKTDQVVLVALFNGCYFASRGTRRFILGFSIFILYWIVFDYMKAFPNYRYNTVHIESLYQAEKALFGIRWNNALITPNEYFALHTSHLLDVFSGLSYLCWVPVPLAFATVLFFKTATLFFNSPLLFFLSTSLALSAIMCILPHRRGMLRRMVLIFFRPRRATRRALVASMRWWAFRFSKAFTQKAPTCLQPCLPSMHRT